MITFKILGEPKPKQSFKFAIRGNDEKQFVSKYQPNAVVKATTNLQWDIKSQLPLGFVPFNEPLKVSVTFVFPILSSWSKKQRVDFDAGKTFYKDTKPDLDNCEKLLWDAMEGIVFINDSRIVDKAIRKIYGTTPRTEVTIELISPNYELVYCPTCIQMTNHISNKCQKCLVN
jgi:Holliday junction resolvase RusA-like endonuclease